MDDAPTETEAEATQGPVARIGIFAFLALGAFWGIWAVGIANIRHDIGFSDTALGFLLAITQTTGALAAARFLRLTRRRPPATVLATTLVVWAAAMVLFGLPTSGWYFALVFFVAGGLSAPVDSSMNAVATIQFEGNAGGLLSFHALYSAGCVLAAIATGFALEGSLSWRWLFFGLALMTAFTSAIALSRHDERLRVSRPNAFPVAIPSPAGDYVDPLSHERSDRALWVIRREGLLIPMVIFAVAEAASGGIWTWGILYLRDSLGAPAAIAAVSFGLSSAIAGMTRLLGGRAFGSRSPITGVAIGAGLGACGLLAESLTHSIALAAIGLTVGAIGLTVIWPLMMSDVGARTSSPATVIGAFTAAGYLGWVGGAPIIGAVTQHLGAEKGLWILVGCASIASVYALLRLRTERSASQQG
ncbi:MAG: MFS transporter [Actinomycetes bacterium]